MVIIRIAVHESLWTESWTDRAWEVSARLASCHGVRWRHTLHSTVCLRRVVSSFQWQIQSLSGDRRLFPALLHVPPRLFSSGRRVSAICSANSASHGDRRTGKHRQHAAMPLQRLNDIYSPIIDRESTRRQRPAPETTSIT